MGRNTVEAYGAKGRKDALPFDPDDITLVTDPNHPLYDRRVHEEPTEAFIANLKAVPQIEPIAVRKNGERRGKPIIECIVGRMRVKAYRIINAERRKKGLEPVWVYGVIRQGTDAEMMEAIIAENEARKEDTPLSRAWKMKRLADLGRDEARLGTVFCCDVQTVRRTLALLDLHESVQAAVAAGSIGATLAAQELVKLPREEQPAALAKLIESGTTKGASAKEAARAIRDGREPGPSLPRMRKRPIVSRAAEALAATGRKDAEIAAGVLRWAMGDGIAEELPAPISTALEKVAHRA